MGLIVVEAVPASSKPPAAGDSMRTSTDGRYGFGASAPSLTGASPMPFSGAERGSALLSKLVKFAGPSSTRQKRYPRASFHLLSALRTLARLRVCFYVCLRGETWLLSLMLESC